MKKSAKTQTAEGTVLSAKKIWFVHINRHPFRPTDRGGALFSYRVTFRFEADGREYTCKKRSAAHGICRRFPLPFGTIFPPLKIPSR